MIENANLLAVVYRPTSTLTPYAKNSNTHSPEQVRQIAASITEFGFTNPVLIDEHGGIIAGHGRVLAADMLGLEQVPCIVLAHLNPTQRRAYVIADNQLAKKSEWDMEVLISELQELANEQFDLALTGFDFDEIDRLMRGLDLFPENTPTPNRAGGVSEPFPENTPTPNRAGGVSEPFPEKYIKPTDSPLLRKFGIPPFSVFDSRQGYWQSRKREWLAILGDTSATKEGTLAEGNILQLINKGSSGFDPVLAEIIFTWFCPVGGAILDPFGGEQTKGFVAGYTGHPYHAIEFREDQVKFNREKTAGMQDVVYTVGDSNHISKLIKRRGFDLVFTSPPYFDLEVYSAEDMSAIGSYEDFMVQYEGIFAQCVTMLADNRFLVVKVGEIRDRDTGAYRNFVGQTVAMIQRLGLHFYNEIILVNPVGTAAIRADRTFKTRKVVRLHQNILVFYKGDMRKITTIFPPVQFEHDLGVDMDGFLPDVPES